MMSAKLCGLFAFAPLLALMACENSPRQGAAAGLQPERLTAAPEAQGIVHASARRPASLANSLTNSEKAEGWELLFDGATTNGWRGYGKNHMPAAWKVENGTLAFDPAGADDRGDVITSGEYTEFDVRLEWKISPKGNSGIFFHVAELPGYHYVSDTGPEMQVLDNAGHQDGLSPTHRAGDLYDLAPASVVSTTLAGEWNEARIVLKDGVLQYWLNGCRVVETTIHDERWTRMIANSKFAGIKGFGVQKKGHFGLQDHGDKVWYRNIKVLRLKK